MFKKLKMHRCSADKFKFKSVTLRWDLVYLMLADAVYFVVSPQDELIEEKARKNEICIFSQNIDYFNFSVLHKKTPSVNTEGV